MRSATVQGEERRPSIGFGLALGFLSVLGPLAIDLYLPALPEMTRALGTTSGHVQRTLSVFFLALAIAQIPIGSLGDRIGRRPVLLGGLGVFVVASFGCASAGSIEALVAWRFLQGCGACAGTAVARAMIRDLHSGHHAARLMALSFLVIGVSPVVAPFLGSILLTMLPWRGLFLVLAGLGLLAIGTATLLLPESLPPARRVPRGTPIVAAYVGLMRNAPFLAWALVAGIATTIPFAFITAAPFVYTGLFGLSARHYSVLLALNAVCSIAATQFAPGLMRRIGGARLVLAAGCVGLVLAAALSLWNAVTPVPLTVFLPASLGLFAVSGLMLTPAVVTALDTTTGGAGAASGLVGTIQLAATAVASIAVSIFPSVSVAPLATILAAALALAVVLAWLCRPVDRVRT